MFVEVVSNGGSDVVEVCVIVGVDNIGAMTQTCGSSLAKEKTYFSQSRHSLCGGRDS